MSERTLVFDTETTGKAFFKLPPSDPSQPRLVQLAALLHDGDNEIASLHCLIIPEYFTTLQTSVKSPAPTASNGPSCKKPTSSPLALS